MKRAIRSAADAVRRLFVRKKTATDRVHARERSHRPSFLTEMIGYEPGINVVNGKPDWNSIVTAEALAKVPEEERGDGPYSVIIEHIVDERFSVKTRAEGISTRNAAERYGKLTTITKIETDGITFSRPPNLPDLILVSISDQSGQPVSFRELTARTAEVPDVGRRYLIMNAFGNEVKCDGKTHRR